MDARPTLLWLCALALLAALSELPSSAIAAPCLGSFRIMGDVGISSITVSQSKDGYIYLFDRRDLQNSKIRLPDGSFGHAVEYTIRRNKSRTISTVTNTWCSAGGYLKDGTIINTSGNDAGGKAVRAIQPCSVGSPPAFAGGGRPPACNTWWEDSSKISLAVMRWYPTQQALPDGRHILIGGTTTGTSSQNIQPNYEFVDPYKTRTGRLYDMPFLREAIPNFLYPFVHLLPSDLLFVFANKAGIIFNYKTNAVVKKVPNIPDGISRSYPSTGASLLLPLDHTNGYTRAEILICGGTAERAGVDTPASNTCYVTDVSKGNIDASRIGWRGPYRLARGRVMPDLIYLLDGTYLIINGAQKGVAGFQTAKEGNLWPEVLRRNGAGGIVINSNFCPSTLTRGYHSSALLIPDGRVFVTGSNGWGRYTTRPGDPFSTEYRIEMWTPPYISQSAIPRPEIKSNPGSIGYNKAFTITIRFARTATPAPSAANIRCALIANSFVTHSISMSLRYLNIPFKIVGNKITATSPPSAVLAPPGPYMLVVTYRDIPSNAKWVTVG